DRRVVVVLDEDVAVLRLEDLVLGLSQELGDHARLLLELQGDRGVVALEIDRSGPSERRDGRVRVLGRVLDETPLVSKSLQPRRQVRRLEGIEDSRGLPSEDVTTCPLGVDHLVRYDM